MPKQGSSKTASRHYVAKFNKVETIIISALAQGTDLSHDLAEECFGRGFISMELNEALKVVKFLSRTTLAAQYAQRTYGVPASFLVSVGLYVSGWDADTLNERNGHASERVERASYDSPGILKWFLETARLLAESPKYRKARPPVSDLRAYVEKICALGFRDVDAEDVLSPIERYGLEQCDLAALLEPNEYHKERFTVYQDQKGVNKLRLSWLDILPLLSKDTARVG